MKNFILIVILFLVFCGLIRIDEAFSNTDSIFNDIKKETVKVDSLDLKQKSNKFTSSSTKYFINAKLNTNKNLVEAEEKIIWKNNSEHPTNEIHFYLLANSLKNENTNFVKANEINLKEENKTEIEIDEILVDGSPTTFNYLKQENQFDSTIAKINLEKQISKNGFVEIKIKFRLKIPRSEKFLGYAANRDFYFFAKWFPKISFYESGKWIDQQSSYIEKHYSEFASYEVDLIMPQNFIAAASGNLIDKKKYGENTVYKFRGNNLNDFAWVASADIIEQTFIYKGKDNSSVKINLFIQPESEKYIDRYKNAIINSLNYFEEKIGTYPFSTITLVDVPKTGKITGTNYSNLITVNSDLFSPVESHQPEKETIYNLSKIFFDGVIGINSFNDAWLGEGISAYLTEKILKEFYGSSYLNFKLFGYYPIFGLNLISYNEIPLVYSLEKIEIPEGALMLQSYYGSPSLATISDPALENLNKDVLFISSVAKPVLMLHSLERFLGKKNLIKILNKYYSEYKFKNPTADDFWNIVNENSDRDLAWFKNDFYSSTKTFDYKISDVKSISQNKYEVIVEKVGAGVSKSDIAFYTDKDTLWQNWDGNSNWQKFIFKTKNEPIGAEVDPFRKNLLEMNFANNSYTIEKQFSASLSFSARWFFWIQNLFLILGSIA